MTSYGKEARLLITPIRYYEGNDDGYYDGYDDGFDAVYYNGYNDSFYEGYNEGYPEGYYFGYDEGTYAGYYRAYYDGYNAGYDNGNTDGYNDFELLFSSEFILEEEPVYSSGFDEAVEPVEETPEIQEEPAYVEAFDIDSSMTADWDYITFDESIISIYALD